MSERRRQDTWAKALAVIEPALQLSDPSFLDEVRRSLDGHGVMRAVAARDSPTIYDWLLGVMQFQGISDANAVAFSENRDPVGWGNVAAGIAEEAPCERLQSYWHFEGCNYRKLSWSCSMPRLLSSCPLPTHPLRNGRLSQGAYHLFLFIRDVCGGDIVGWIDDRMERADQLGVPNRTAVMRRALLEPMGNIHGLSNKVLSMALSSLLMVADPHRERWVTTGASMIVIDTLIHNFLHRTGILRRFHADHLYGPGCYAPGGCSTIVEELAARVDARTFNPVFPANFPRYIQHAIWRFCSQSHCNICNGNQIDDSGRCEKRYCPSFANCERVRLARASAKLGKDQEIEVAPQSAISFDRPPTDAVVLFSDYYLGAINGKT